MKLAYLAFTNTGEALAKRIAEAIGGTVSRCNQPEGHREWTRRNFEKSEGLVFVGAAGIAVRSIAPFLKSKAEDPAVVAVDECGKFAISLVSGHLGGANELAERIAEAIGAIPVITTATDRHGIFAVDDWARRNGCVVAEKERIVQISSALLAGETVDFYSDYPIAGAVPEGIRFHLVTEEGGGSGSAAEAVEAAPRTEAASVSEERGGMESAAGQDSEGRNSEDVPGKIGEGRLCVELGYHRRIPGALHLLPKAVFLGVGCRKGIFQEMLESGFRDFTKETGLDLATVCGVASIDLKKNEEALILFGRNHGWEFRTWPAEELAALEGDFTPSEFVASVTGVDNVCERSALRAAGPDGRVVIRKYAKYGATFAAAEKAMDFSWEK